MQEHKTAFTEPPSADRFLRCSDMTCRKVGFSRGETACSCGASVVHATLGEITSGILLRRTAKIPLAKRGEMHAEHAGFHSFSDWAAHIRIDNGTFVAHAARIMHSVQWSGHVVALDNSGRRFACDAEFCREVVRTVASLPNKRIRTVRRLETALAHLSAESSAQNVHGSTD